MNAKALFLARLKATLRSPGAMSIFLLALLIPVLLGLYSARVDQARLRVAVVNADQGDLGRRLIEMVEAGGDVAVEEMDEHEARRLMRLDLLQCLFVIRDDFTQRLEARQFDHLVDLTVAPGCTYGASVSEPVINAVMKLWFEQQTLYDIARLRQDAGVPMDQGQTDALQAAMDRAWTEGAQVRVVHVTQETEAPPPTVTGVFARTALCWFAALSLLFLVLSGQWMERFGQPQLQQRLRQGGLGFAKGFFVQASAQLVMVYAGFLLLLLLTGDLAALAGMLLPALVYGGGLLGLALLICTLCGDLTSLLLMGPVLGLAVGFLSGLVVDLPDWGHIWVMLSSVLPGRWFYAALDGSWNALAALAVSALWLVLGTSAARLAADRRRRREYRRSISEEQGGTAR